MQKRVRLAAALVALVAATARAAPRSDDSGSGSGSIERPDRRRLDAVADRRFAATGMIHKIAGEEFVDRLNESGGLLGRPVRVEGARRPVRPGQGRRSSTSS